jgi:hypothetical protein
VTTFYFAYGSNMSSARLLERIARAVPHGPARLAGWQLALDKPSRDGSAKANIAPAPDARVWGVVWRIPLHEWPVLDRFEPGYARIACELVTGSGERVAAETYVYHGPRTRAAPFDWYVEHLVAGAEEHALPADYRRLLRTLRSRATPGATGR